MHEKSPTCQQVLMRYSQFLVKAQKLFVSKSSERESPPKGPHQYNDLISGYARIKSKRGAGSHLESVLLTLNSKR